MHTFLSLALFNIHSRKRYWKRISDTSLSFWKCHSRTGSDVTLKYLKYLAATSLHRKWRHTVILMTFKILLCSRTLRHTVHSPFRNYGFKTEVTSFENASLPFSKISVFNREWGHTWKRRVRLKTYVSRLELTVILFWTHLNRTRYYVRLLSPRVPSWQRKLFSPELSYSTSRCYPRLNLQTSARSTASFGETISLQPGLFPEYPFARVST